MTPDLEEYLRSRYPQTFTASSKIEVGDGWLPLLEELALVLPKWVTITHAYSKLGSLRVDCHPHVNTKVLAAVQEKSLRICEDCGSPGRLENHYGVMRTTCEQHYLDLKRWLNPKQFAKDHPDVIEQEKRRKNLVGMAVIYRGETVYVNLNKDSFTKNAKYLEDLLEKIREDGLYP